GISSASGRRNRPFLHESEAPNSPRPNSLTRGDVMARKVARYGWIPDLPDQRDYMYAAPSVALTSIPAKVDLRPQCPKTVYNQCSLGSCTANAIAGAFEFDEIKQGSANVFTPSRLFIYYNERVLMGDNYVKQDPGAYLRDGIKSVATQGAPPE